MASCKKCFYYWTHEKKCHFSEYSFNDKRKQEGLDLTKVPFEEAPKECYRSIWLMTHRPAVEGIKEVYADNGQEITTEEIMRAWGAE